MKDSRNKYLKRIDNLGFGNYLRYMAHKKTGIPSSGEFKLHSKLVGRPLICRGGTSDIDVFKHVFVLGEYAAIELPDRGLIIDCGANVGFSTVYFLERFPHVRVVAVEPDPDNFRMLERNTRSYGERCTCLQAGVWPEPTSLRVVDTARGDGRAWARGVEAVTSEPRPGDIRAVSIDELMRQAGVDCVTLLKVDIEGGERELFARQTDNWLGRVERIAIELHGEECTAVYRAAVDKAGLISSLAGGLTWSVRPGE